MEIKKIKMSPKKGGNGFVSSYSVNIGSNEARECGLVDAGTQKVIIKVIDPDNQQIIIKEKKYTLTDEILQTVIDYSVRSNELNTQMELSLPGTEVYGGFRTVSMSDLLAVKFGTDNPYANELHALDKEFNQYLLSLSFETVTDLMTLMYMGRENNADMTLPTDQRFVDYWVYLERIGCFEEGHKAIASQVMEKTPLAQYLQNGRRILMEPVQAEMPVEAEDSEEDYQNGDWL